MFTMCRKTLLNQLLESIKAALHSDGQSGISVLKTAADMVVYKADGALPELESEPVWPRCKGVRLVSRRTSVQFRFGPPHSSNFYGLRTMSCDSGASQLMTHLKWRSSLHVLLQEPFWW